MAQACPSKNYRGKKVLVIVPGRHTHRAGGFAVPNAVRQQTGRCHRSVFDVMIALGTHQPMSEEAICGRLEITAAERNAKYSGVRFINHEWNNPAALKNIGAIPSAEISELTEGRFAMDVPVEINRMVFEYDQIIIIGPVFPHEVVGFSGGNKYLFPGVGGPEILNFFHWLGAVVTNPMIIGNKWTPVRKVVDRAGAMVERWKTLLLHGGACRTKVLAGIFAGTPEGAWDEASELFRKVHITYVDKPFHTILSCAPAMYWTRSGRRANAYTSSKFSPRRRRGIDYLRAAHHGGLRQPRQDH